MLKSVMGKLFVKHNKLLQKLTWNHFKKYGGEWDEIYSEVSLLFTKICQEKFDKSRKVKLTTYLTSLIPYRLLNWEKIRITKQNMFQKYEENKRPELENIQEGKNLFDWEDLAEDLTEDARLVLKVLFQCPQQVQMYVNDHADTGVVYRNFLREYFSGYEWDYPRVQKAFQEIRSVL